MDAATFTETRILMGMPVSVQIVDSGTGQAAYPPAEMIERVYAYFQYIDEKFSTYKPYSEISLVNQHALALEETSYDMRTVFALAEDFRQATGGYFNIQHAGVVDPSGLVKGWAISNAAEIVREAGYENFVVEAGGDFQAMGKNSRGQNWRVGIRSPFNLQEIVKVLSVSNRGVATSGTYVRGEHIYNPLGEGGSIAAGGGGTAGGSYAAFSDIVSLTVVGPDIYETDCYATAAFAMGRVGIEFIETLEGFEGYQIDQNGLATFTSGFERYVERDDALD